MKGISIFKSEGLIPVTIAVVVSVFMVVAVVQATTTISTNIVTEGTLAVTGDTTLGHASTTQISNSGVSWFTGDTTLGHASTTQFSNIQTTNSATTTAYLGCVQTYATTTATPIKLIFYASSTVAGVTTSQAVTTAGAGGFVLFSYGYCP